MKRYLRSPLSQALAAVGLLLPILAFTGAPASAEDPPIAESDLQYALLLQDLGRRDCSENTQAGRLCHIPREVACDLNSGFRKECGTAVSAVIGCVATIFLSSAGVAKRHERLS